ncbi:urea transporter [Hoeflea poritis]|uniref:Urea transporter n=1 Tax=Hoeflea poritis TaxID=2993659 RepID=A0ABT4VP91_9HYPH|nr:urea transporter [Hoeflea poritis]MDA4845887.1 urea transporter [Hoeflea poritis]
MAKTPIGLRSRSREKPSVDFVFPAAEPGQLPCWRLVLRGCSQLCFQSNELTGLFFLAAVLVASPIAAAYMLAAAIIAPSARMLLGDRGAGLETGLPGLNPSLIAVSLPASLAIGLTTKVPKRSWRSTIGRNCCQPSISSLIFSTSSIRMGFQRGTMRWSSASHRAVGIDVRFGRRSLNEQRSIPFQSR